MNTRLKQFLAAENITQAQFADSINVVRASVSHILSGRNNPSFDFIKAMMSRYPNLSMDWFMFGKGKMYKETTKESPTADSDLLFPIEASAVEPVPVELSVSPLRIPEIALPDDEKKTEQISTELNTLNNTMQPIVKQRKVTKVIIMFDDGSYQEL